MPVNGQTGELFCREFKIKEKKKKEKKKKKTFQSKKILDTEK